MNTCTFNNAQGTKMKRTSDTHSKEEGRRGSAPACALTRVSAGKTITTTMIPNKFPRFKCPHFVPFCLMRIVAQAEKKKPLNDNNEIEILELRRDDTLWRLVNIC
jgi:hypothetical protein